MGAKVRVKYGWEDEGRTGIFIGSVFTDIEWAIVIWDDGEDPCTFKRRALEWIN